MPQRDDELPEGTDHIINGAMETGGDTSGGGGFIGAAGGDGTGGTATGDSGTGGGTEVSNDRGNGGGAANDDAGAGGVVDQLRGQASALRDQAGDRVREFAEGGKTRASDALEELSRVVGETADTIDERMGEEYGEYARKAADAVSGFADTLRRKEVDELYGNVRDAVRKSPGIAIGIAAVLGFTLVRLIKSGTPDEGENETRGNAPRAGGGRGGAGA